MVILFPEISIFLEYCGKIQEPGGFYLWNRNCESLSLIHISLAGKCCESGDLLGEHMPIQPVQSGDIVAVLSTGAYNYSMASNYNRLCRPAVVMVKDGQPRLIVRRESLEDLLRNDL